MKYTSCITRVGVFYVLFAGMMLCLNGAFPADAQSLIVGIGVAAMKPATQTSLNEKTEIGLTHELQAGSSETSSLRWHWDNPRPQANGLKAVWGSSAQDVYVFGCNGKILHYDGVSWKLMNTGIKATFFQAWGSSAQDVFAVAQFGIILHYDGVSWKKMTTVTENFLHGVWGSSPQDVFAVGNWGTILHYTSR